MHNASSSPPVPTLQTTVNSVNRKSVKDYYPPLSHLAPDDLTDVSGLALVAASAYTLCILYCKSIRAGLGLGRGQRGMREPFQHTRASHRTGPSSLKRQGSTDATQRKPRIEAERTRTEKPAVHHAVHPRPRHDPRSTNTTDEPAHCHRHPPAQGSCLLPATLLVVQRRVTSRPARGARAATRTATSDETRPRPLLTSVFH